MANTTGLGDTIYAAVKNALGNGEGYDDLKKPYGLGDTIYVAVKKAINDAGGSGGGGSSDFTTAEVTIVNSTASRIEGGAANTIDSIEEGSYSNFNLDVRAAATSKIGAILYKGHCALVLFTEGTVSIEGSATDLGGGSIDVTGDCTITVS